MTIDDKLLTLSESPGVYIMKDAAGEIIYIGKAKNLKNRVKQYFLSPERHAAKVRAMVSHVADFDTILTDSELEAFTLESNLIKLHKPRYNILLKDDKHYPYVRIDLKAPYPRVEVVRRFENDGARYFGPFFSANALRQVFDSLRVLFPLRTCKRDIKLGEIAERPCLQYQMGKCLAPCLGHVPPQEYRHFIDQVILLLGGKRDTLRAELSRQMDEASANWEFEQAARYRDKLAHLDALGERQQAISTGGEDRDIVGLASSGERTVIQLLHMREGRLLSSKAFRIEGAEGRTGELLSAFIIQHYPGEARYPKEILLPSEPEDSQAMEQWLSGLAGERVYILQPQRGDKRKLLTLADANAQATLSKWLGEAEAKDAQRRALVQLMAALSLPKPPQRIEAYDISHIQGTNAVASMVVFEDGRPAKKEYRRFKISPENGGDDFASMHEVVLRRLTHAAREKDGNFEKFPDVLLIDGGKGQLSAALSAMTEAGHEDIPVFSLAKSFEEVFLPGEKQPIRLKAGSEALKLIMRVRDEAHRFAITFHRSLRGKSGLMSNLQNVKGVGDKRRRALFTRFRTLERIREATLEELEAVEGMNKPAAEAVYNYLRSEDS